MAITAKTNIEKNNINNHKTIKNYKKNLKRKNKKIQLNQQIQNVSQSSNTSSSQQSSSAGIYKFILYIIIYKLVSISTSTAESNNENNIDIDDDNYTFDENDIDDIISTISSEQNTNNNNNSNNSNNNNDHIVEVNNNNNNNNNSTSNNSFVNATLFIVAAVRFIKILADGVKLFKVKWQGYQKKEFLLSTDIPDFETDPVWQRILTKSINIKDKHAPYVELIGDSSTVPKHIKNKVEVFFNNSIKIKYHDPSRFCLLFALCNVLCLKPNITKMLIKLMNGSDHCSFEELANLIGPTKLNYGKKYSFNL
jgi:hypothetical protein